MSSTGRIRILPEKLANKIAAGEVVERPASVVKELIENSLDAGAMVVRVEVEAGGRRLIRVTDDGIGMTPDEALIAVERHATSKISSEKDLFAIRTLGFRGEALHSIASVSRFELLTRSRERDEGVRVRMEGGAVEAVEPDGCAPGTVVTARNLFYNVPARLKFLKSQSTELSHVSDVVARIAMAHPAVHFQLLHDGREVIESPPSGDRAGRIADALGMTTLERMREIGLDADAGHRVHGYVSLPDLNRSSGSHLYVYVNGRFIKDRIVNHAIIESYRSFLPKDRYPVVALFIEVPADEVDVNVHPTKAEVRFLDAGRIHDLIRAAVSGAFERKSASPPAPAPVPTDGKSLPSPDKAGSSAPQDKTLEERVKKALLSAVDTQIHKHPDAQRDFFKRPISKLPLPQPPPAESNKPLPAPSPITPMTQPRYEGYFASLTILGQLRNTYVVCQASDGLVLIDQHAAHERAAYERLRRDYAARRIQRQALLFPETLELGIKEVREMNRFLDEIRSLGFDIEPFGGKSFLVRALPAILGAADPRALLLDLIEALSELRSTSSFDDRLDEVFARLSCHAVIRAGRALSMDEMQALMKTLDEADYPLTCPHGRPICVVISYEELERMFGRR